MSEPSTKVSQPDGKPHSHPVFARVYEKVAEIAERRGGAEHRERLLAGLSGQVIEVGAGSGANFAHYPPTVSEVIADPSATCANGRSAQQRRHRSPSQSWTVVPTISLAKRSPSMPGWRRSCSAPRPTSSARSRSCFESSARVASCVSTSTSSRIGSGRRAISASPTRRCGPRSRRLPPGTRHEDRHRAGRLCDRDMRPIPVQPRAVHPARPAHPWDGPASVSC